MAAPYGDVVRSLREQRGWSQQDLAGRSKVHRDTIVRAEQSGNVGVLYLYRIATALNVEVTELFGGSAPVAVVAAPPSVWSLLQREQRAEVIRYAYRLVGARVPPGAIE